MDSDSCKSEQITKEGNQENSDGPKQERVLGDFKFDGRNVFPTVRIRRAFPNNNEVNKFLLDYGFYFLLPFGTVLYSLFFILS